MSNTAASFSGRSPLSQTALSPRSRHFPFKVEDSRRSQQCHASLEGSLVRSRFPGFDDEEATSSEPKLITPESASWGLSVPQMKAMGISTIAERTGNLDPVSFLQLNKQAVGLIRRDML